MLNRLRSLFLLQLFFFYFFAAYAGETGNERLISNADSLLEAGLYEQAIDQYREFINSNDQPADEEKKQLAECYSQIGFCYFKLNNYNDAITAFQEALRLQREIGDMESVANTLNNIGLNYKLRGNYDKAVEYYEQTISIDEKLGNNKEISMTFNNIGMVYRIWGRYDKAIEYFERSLSLKTRLNDQAGVSKTLNNLGLVYTDWQKYDQAVLNFRESLRIEESLDHESDIAIRLNNIGRVYFYQDHYDSALYYLNKSLLIQQKYNDKGQLALTFNNIGKVYLNQKKYDEAGHYLNSALLIFNELDKQDEKSTALANLSEISLSMGNEEKALQLLDSSTAIAEKLNMKSQLQKNFLYYSNIFNGRKDYKKSLDYYKKYTDIKDSVFTHEILSQLSDFQIKYETEKKENEIELLKKNEVIQGLALKKQTIFRNSMAAVSVLLLALASIIFYGFQLKKKDNRMIEAARAKSDHLLLNVLPAGVAQDLKEKGKTEPQVFDSATVCFVDIVNFTEKTSTLAPVTLIDELNQIFTEFDKIIEKYGCERIKTIGDCYMAVCGLPEPNHRHAQAIAGSCLEMIRHMENRNIESNYIWEVRAGINSGPVIAGVVGVKKYIYDVFGDTINTASRMESTSEPMKVNISESTYLLIKDEFKTEFRGELEVRGKGKLKMYFVKS